MDPLKLADEAENAARVTSLSSNPEDYLRLAEQYIPDLASALREQAAELERLREANLEFPKLLTVVQAENEKKDEALRHYKAADTWKLSEDETTYTYEGNHLHPSAVAAAALSPTRAQPMEEE